MGDGLFQPTHLLLLLFVALLVFGPKRFPEFGKGVGEAIRALKKALHQGPEDAK
jgi:sec-independent protein translocase protein TatA